MPEGMDVRPMLVSSFREWLEGRHPQFVPGAREKLLARLPELRDMHLACWCELPKPGQRDHCHAAVLIEFVANRERKGGQA